MVHKEFVHHGEHPIEADASELLFRLAERHGVHLADAIATQRLLRRVPGLFRKARSPIRVHGRRAEEMFSYVVASLGLAKAIKREDTGSALVQSNRRVTIPDFRVMLTGKREILVEVKNFNGGGVNAFQTKSAYLQRLASYGQLFHRDVYLAIYWARWRIWTLHGVKRLLQSVQGERLDLSLLQAVPESEMRLLGDANWATRYPLTLRIDVDAELISRRKNRAKYVMTIRDVRMLAAGKAILAKRDRKIAWEFMLYGRWEESDPVPVMKDEKIVAVDFEFNPIEPDPSLGFAIVGAASSLASSKFNYLTADSRGIRQLRVARLPMPSYPGASEKYYGTDLPLWRFVQKPRAGVE